MKNIEEFCLELKNDILKDIGEDKNWDIADYTMRFYGNSGEGGLTILKKDNQEVRRVRQERFLYFWDAINLLIDRSKTNKGRLTIYPSGLYESSFIWDEAAHLDNLARGVKAWFSSIYQYACEKIQDRCSQLSIDCPAQAEMSISFDKFGISKPAMFYVANNPQMAFKLHLEQTYCYIDRSYEEEFAEYDAVRTHTEGDVISEGMQNYQITNEGKLKGYYPRWNKLIFSLNPNDQYSFSDEKLKFEWVEENA